MTDQSSIKESLDVIRKALENDTSDSKYDAEDDILILDKLVKEDGTIDIIENNIISKDEVKAVLENNIEKYFDQHLDKWFDKNIPNYVDKYFKNK